MVFHVPIVILLIPLIQIHIKITNNQVKNESLFVDLACSQGIEVKHLLVKWDAQLMVNQVNC